MSEFSTAFPNSTKVLIDGPRGVRVPMREIALSGGEQPLRIYDSSGPQDHDVNAGLPKLREGWVESQREVLAEVRQSFADLPIWRAGYNAGEPVGGDALAGFAETTYDVSSVEATP